LGIACTSCTIAYRPTEVPRRKRAYGPEWSVRIYQQKGWQFLTDGQPVISVDTKKKNWSAISRMRAANGGQRHTRRGQVHDFIDPKLKRAVPYGVYDINNNTGWVSVERTTTLPLCGKRHPPLVEGHGKKYPKPKGLLVTADGGGSVAIASVCGKSNYRNWLTNSEFPITVCHLPLEQASGIKSNAGFFFHQHQLARQTLAQLSYNRRAHRRYDYRDGPDRTC
jgi:hypothetical protein